MITDAAIAELLDRELQNETIWACGGRPPGEAHLREALALEAVRIYTETDPILAARISEASSTVDDAVGVLRDIADRCAVFSHDWAPKRLRGWTNIPDRSTVVGQVKKREIDVWAARIGQGLRLPVVDEGGPGPSRFRQILRTRASKAAIASDFSMMKGEFQKISAMRGAQHVWLANRPELKRAASGLIAVSRDSILGARAMGDGGAETVAEATLAMAQGMFVATNEASRAPIFPTAEFLQLLLERREGDKWLKRHGRGGDDLTQAE